MRSFRARAAGIAAGLLLTSAAAAETRMFVYSTFKAGSTYAAEIGNVDPEKDTGPVQFLSLYDGAEFVEFSCDRGGCTRERYRLSGGNAPSYRMHVMQEKAPAKMPGSRAAKPKKAIFDCGKEKVSAQGFVSQHDADRWIGYMLRFRHENGNLEGCDSFAQ